MATNAAGRKIGGYSANSPSRKALPQQLTQAHSEGEPITLQRHRLLIYRMEHRVNTTIINRSFESDLLDERMAELYRTHPREAALIADLLQTLNYQTTTIRSELHVRGLVIALGFTLSKKMAAGLPGFEGGLEYFVRDGALSIEQARELRARAEAIYHTGT